MIPARLGADHYEDESSNDPATRNARGDPRRRSSLGRNETRFDGILLNGEPQNPARTNLVYVPELRDPYHLES